MAASICGSTLLGGMDEKTHRETNEEATHASFPDL
jgi:hypothetical protein